MAKPTNVKPAATIADASRDVAIAEVHIAVEAWLYDRFGQLSSDRWAQARAAADDLKARLAAVLTSN